MIFFNNIISLEDWYWLKVYKISWEIIKFSRLYGLRFLGGRKFLNNIFKLISPLSTQDKNVKTE